MKYRKKPVVVEAVEWNGQQYHWPDSFQPKPRVYDVKLVDGELHGKVLTLHGYVDIKVGDYIIRGSVGEYYPCSKGIFNLTYEPVVEEEPSAA